jgi:hypothetical protein
MGNEERKKERKKERRKERTRNKMKWVTKVGHICMKKSR